MLYRIDKGIHHEEFARRLRKRQTRAEEILWRHVRAKRFNGIKFRRQVPIGPYIVDFLCVGAMLVIEIDGASHSRPGAREYDLVRENYLRSWGFRVLRFTNGQVMNERSVVLRTIFEALPACSPSP